MLRQIGLAQLLAATALAQSSGTSPDGMVAVQTLRLQVQGASVQMEVELRNVSAKEITACDGYFLVRYPDGKEAKPHWGIDLLGSMALAEVYGLTREGLTLKPGERFTQKWSVPRGAGGEPPVSVTPRITTLMFADRTAVGDPNQIGFLLRTRADQAAETAGVIVEVRTLLGKQDPPAAVTARISEVRSQTEAAGMYSGESARVLSRLRGDLQNLQSAMEAKGKAGADKFLEVLHVRHEMLLQHSELAESPTPPALAAGARLAGEWKNPALKSSVILRLQVHDVGGRFFVRAFGNCALKECDWGEVPAEGPDSSSGFGPSPDPDSLTAHYSVGSSSFRMLVSPQSPGWVRVETRSIPAADSGKPPTTRVDLFSRTGEACLGFNPNTTTVALIRGSWIVVDRDHALMAFGDRKDLAERALSVIQYYRPSQTCFVGRPGPSLKYMLLAGGVPPSGPMAGESCVPFDLAALSVMRLPGRWVLSDGRHFVLGFGDSHAEAERSLEIIKRHGFTRWCFVGGPDPRFEYLRY